MRRRTGLDLLATARRPVACFLLAISALSVLAAAILDIKAGNSEEATSRWLKFGALCLVAVAAFLFEGLYDGKDRFRLRLALSLSVVADLLIGILGQFIAGLGVFAVVHLVYSWRHMRKITTVRAEVLLALGVTVFGAVVMWLSAERMKEAGLLIPSLVYAVPLSLSLYAGLGVFLRDLYRGHACWMIAVGSALFFAVDVAVAHYNAMPAGEMRTWLGIAVWPLYLPAQLLLCLSAEWRAGSGISPGSPAKAR